MNALRPQSMTELDRIQFLCDPDSVPTRVNPPPKLFCYRQLFLRLQIAEDHIPTPSVRKFLPLMTYNALAIHLTKWKACSPGASPLIFTDTFVGPESAATGEVSDQPCAAVIIFE